MKKIVKYLFVGAFASLLLGAGFLLAVYLWFSKDLPSLTKVHDYQLPVVTTVYANDNSVLGYFYDEKRFLVNLDKMPLHLINAFFAAEDASFFQHSGIDVKAIIRAFLTNLKTGKATSGGSTITQQVVKRLLLSPEKSYERKIKEAILSYRLEKYLGKEQILYIYLNQIFFGNNAYGVEAAARTYFGKHVEELTVAEAAVLAGLPKAPSRNNPYRDPENIKVRQLYVLGQMLEKGFIPQDVYDQALAQELVYKSMPDPSWGLGAWYLEEVRRQLITFFTEENIQQLKLPLSRSGKDLVYQGGLHIYTAMDPVHQLASEVAMREGLHASARRRGWTGALENIAEESFASFNAQNLFAPEKLDNAGWAKALVVHVEKDKAEVALGDYKGVVSVSTMGWARKPNPDLSTDSVATVVDATKVLGKGDVIWVSAVGAVGGANPVGVPAQPERKEKPIAAYDSSKVTKETPIALALEIMPEVQGALASIDISKGELVSLVGGYEFTPLSQFNRATQSLRQPGSSFKPIVYSAAIDNGLTAGSIILDAPYVQSGNPGEVDWTPSNFDGKFEGPILLRTALAKSRNVCTVRIAQRIGMPAIIQRAHDLGIVGDILPVLAVSLGSYEVTPLNLTEAYTAFPNGGKRVKPRLIREIKDNWGNPILAFEPEVIEAITPQNAYIMSYLLREAVNAGTGTRAKVLKRPIAGKTGTSNNERDGWFMGFSPTLVTGVYVGFDNNLPMGKNETGARAALPIFVSYRQRIDHLYPPDDFVMPEGITMSFVDAFSGYSTSPANTEVGFNLPFVSGTEPRVADFQQTKPEDNSENQGVNLLKQMY